MSLDELLGLEGPLSPRGEVTPNLTSYGTRGPHTSWVLEAIISQDYPKVLAPKLSYLDPETSYLILETNRVMCSLHQPHTFSIKKGNYRVVRGLYGAK